MTIKNWIDAVREASESDLHRANSIFFREIPNHLQLPPPSLLSLQTPLRSFNVTELGIIEIPTDLQPIHHTIAPCFDLFG